MAVFCMDVRIASAFAKACGVDPSVVTGVDFHQRAGRPPEVTFTVAIFDTETKELVESIERYVGFVRQEAVA